MVLACILVLSITCAYMVTQSARVPIRQAEKILAEIRANGLSAYWLQQGIELKYELESSNPNIIAQLNLIREATADGFRGAILRSGRDSQAAEAWVLSEDALTGQYDVESNFGRFIKMRLTFEDENLTISSREFRVQAKTPANYIPEGLMELVIYQTARSGKDATFSMIVNEHALVGEKVRFFQVQIKPQDQYSATVYMPALRGMDRSDYKFDSDGIVQEIFFPSQQTKYQLIEKRTYKPSEKPESTESKEPEN